MPRILKDITITEVSSVDRGAGRGVKVLLMKRDDPTDPNPEKTMPTSKEIQDLIAKAVSDAVTVAVKAATDPLTAVIAKQGSELAFLKMSDDEQAHCAKMGDDDKKAFMAMTAEERKAKMMSKSDVDPIAKAMQPVLAENVELKKRLDALDLERDQESFRKRAVTMGLTADDGETVRKAYRGDAESQVALEKKMTEMNAALQSARKIGKVFGEFGSTLGGGATGHDAMVAKSAEIRKAHPNLTEAQAYAKAYEDPANADLRKQIKDEEAKVRSTIVT